METHLIPRADEIRFARIRHETDEEAILRIRKEIEDWRNPNFFKGFSQAERGLNITGQLKCLASIEKRVAYKIAQDSDVNRVADVAV
jgi:hypothetical protein